MSAGFVQILEFLKKSGKVIKNLEFFFKGTASAEALFFSVVKSHSILLVNCFFETRLEKVLNFGSNNLCEPCVSILFLIQSILTVAFVTTLAHPAQ